MYSTLVGIIARLLRIPRHYLSRDRISKLVSRNKEVKTASQRITITRQPIQNRRYVNNAVLADEVEAAISETPQAHSRTTM